MFIWEIYRILARMKITDVKAFPIRLPGADYFGGRGAETNPLPDTDIVVQPQWRGIFSERLQTTLVIIETDTGLTGYGEAHSPIAPEVSANIVNRILRPLLYRRDPMPTGVLRREMYDSMTTRGHFTGFMLDAIAGVDNALWDIKGKALGLPVYVLPGWAFQRPYTRLCLRNSRRDDRR